MKSLSLNLLSSQRQSWIYPPASTPSMLSHISPAPVKNVKGTRNETLLPGFQEALCMLEAKCRAATAFLVSGRWNGKEIHAYLKKKSPPKTKVPEPSPLRSPPGKPCVPCPVECSMRCPSDMALAGWLVRKVMKGNGASMNKPHLSEPWCRRVALGRRPGCYIQPPENNSSHARGGPAATSNPENNSSHASDMLTPELRQKKQQISLWVDLQSPMASSSWSF